MSDLTDRRVVDAVHGRRERVPDPAFEAEMARHLRQAMTREALVELYGRFASGLGSFDLTMRRVILKALAKRCGDGVRVGAGVGFLHPETFEIGEGVFLGDQAYIQGRSDGRCIIGRGTWIGPQSYFDARNLVIGERVGWAPGARVLGSTHTGVPATAAIIETDLVIEAVTVEDGADVGVNVVILPGVTIGRGAIVGAGAVVTKNVAPFSIVAGVPAEFLRWREGCNPDQARD